MKLSTFFKMKKNEYLTPKCDILALEGGQMMDPSSGNLPTLEVATEEEW